MKKWEKLSDLRNYRIRATRGYTYTGEFISAANNKKLNVVFSTNDEINFRMMFKNRIDILVIGSVAGYSLLQRKFDSSLMHSVDFNRKPLVSFTNHILFPKKILNLNS
ncbi:hypothetical protein [Spartinivicinus ruber]|uniref:hypothetical protein n=1 Tax=Spartinivicinus ruber TaxID=2683272 RepID=UPI0013D429EE|nr:hypothetical protein [Spartinivicinus ruber]